MTHRIHFTTRQIAPADLPTARDMDGTERPATDADLLNMGIQSLGNDLYSCVEQYRRDDELLIATGEIKWEAHGIEMPGTLVVDGPDRYKRLPPDIAPKVLRARVIHSTDPTTTAVAIVQASLAEQAAAIADNVGLLDTGAPLVDLSVPSATLAEAQRLADAPDVVEMQRKTIPMIQVDPAAHFVEASGLEPHRWAGERRF